MSAQRKSFTPKEMAYRSLETRLAIMVGDLEYTYEREMEAIDDDSRKHIDRLKRRILWTKAQLQAAEQNLT